MQNYKVIKNWGACKEGEIIDVSGITGMTPDLLAELIENGTLVALEGVVHVVEVSQGVYDTETNKTTYMQTRIDVDFAGKRVVSFEEVSVEGNLDADALLAYEKTREIGAVIDMTVYSEHQTKGDPQTGIVDPGHPDMKIVDVPENKTENEGAAAPTPAPEVPAESTVTEDGKAETVLPSEEVVKYFAGKKIVSQGNRMVNNHQYHWVMLEDGSQCDLTAEDYELIKNQL